ncbi:RNA ligase [Chryseobacterium sp.]|uniref:RNA ligase n=1 Tax=Chryseobacterium sp. TaxID=1871047 RepID=UPI002FC76451
MELNIVNFIKTHTDWEQELARKPYYIIVKRKSPFILFSYNQIKSDFANPIVKECRGIILEEQTLTPVCVPFFKFGNYGEGYADIIDWGSARVQEKIDGSLIKVWNYKNEWHISTNGNIDARDSNLQSGSPYKTFYELFNVAAGNAGLCIENLDKNFTWMFELISQYNRVVVPHEKPDIVHIGTRNIHTLVECDKHIGIKKPKMFNLNSLSECIATAETLPFSEEGYVVVDNDWHRNKIKSPAYVAIHHLKGNGAITNTKAIGLIRLNEQNEFLTYYPEYANLFESIKGEIEQLTKSIDADIYKIGNKDVGTRGDFSKLANGSCCPPALYCWLDRKCLCGEEYLWQLSDDKIAELTQLNMLSKAERTV